VLLCAWSGHSCRPCTAKKFHFCSLMVFIELQRAIAALLRSLSAVMHCCFQNMLFAIVDLHPSYTVCQWRLDCNRFPLCRWPPIGKGFSKGVVTLAGDAAHPMTPNLGQGGCTALEVSSPTCTVHTCSFGHAGQVSIYAVLSNACRFMDFPETPALSCRSCACKQSYH